LGSLSLSEVELSQSQRMAKYQSKSSQLCVCPLSLLSLLPTPSANNTTSRAPWHLRPRPRPIHRGPPPFHSRNQHRRDCHLPSLLSFPFQNRRCRLRARFPFLPNTRNVRIATIRPPSPPSPAPKFPRDVHPITWSRFRWMPPLASRRCLM
jgi:hypothetical protein